MTVHGSFVPISDGHFVVVIVSIPSGNSIWAQAVNFNCFVGILHILILLCFVIPVSALAIL